MQFPSAATILALVLLLGCMLPAQCLAMADACAPAHSSCHAPLGSHGHEGQTSPDHRCCHSSDLSQMAKRSVVTFVPYDIPAPAVNTFTPAEFTPAISVTCESFDFCQPPPAVLRN